MVRSDVILRTRTRSKGLLAQQTVRDRVWRGRSQFQSSRFTATSGCIQLAARSLVAGSLRQDLHPDGITLTHITKPGHSRLHYPWSMIHERQATEGSSWKSTLEVLSLMSLCQNPGQHMVTQLRPYEKGSSSEKLNIMGHVISMWTMWHSDNRDRHRSQSITIVT